MITLRYSLKFTAPAFLGDAHQSACWRTPPIKALLRQWWRVAYSADCSHRADLNRMRKAEAGLFGTAADQVGGSGRSRVRLRLDRWDPGRLKATDWERLDPVRHPEVDKGIPPADLYLGYGPVTLRPGHLKGNAAIQEGESAGLAVGIDSGVADEEQRRILLALSLMHRYGALGGRNRNGWGSFSLTPLEGTPTFPKQAESHLHRPWRDALALDWAHALGTDELGPLVWTTGPKAGWRQVMVALAKLKIDLRVGFDFKTGKHADQPEKRHWLCYPVTNHSVREWGDRRLPNTLRFKLRPVDGSQVEGLVFHMPALPPPAFKPEPFRKDIESLWKTVHSELDRKLRPADGRRSTG
jgi:CRISPR-associated protein Cmr1